MSQGRDCSDRGGEQSPGSRRRQELAGKTMKAGWNHNWNTHELSLEQGSQEAVEVHHLLRSVFKLFKLGRLDKNINK